MQLSHLPVPYEGESPYPSLSGFHDYEPQLEFDDAELLERKQEEDQEEGQSKSTIKFNFLKIITFYFKNMMMEKSH